MGYRREPNLPMHECGLSHPNDQLRKDTPRRDYTKGYILNSENDLHHDPIH